MIDQEVELPDGWAVAPLSEVVTLVNEKVDPALVPDSHYIGLEHIEATSMRLLGHGSGSDVKSAKTKFRAGDVLYGKLRPYLNKVTRPSFDGICSTDILVFGDAPRLDRGYLANYLNQIAIANRAHHLSNGVELPRVDWKTLSELPIRFPLEKSEQLLIVEAIEHARQCQAGAQAHLLAARRAVERFRQAVLSAACSGRLTADWRDGSTTVESAGDLVRLISDARRARLGQRYKATTPPSVDVDAPEGWTWCTIGALVDVATGATPLRRQSAYYGGSIPWVTSGAVNAGIVTEPSEFITERAITETNAKVFPAGTLIVAMYGEGQTRGRVAELGIAAATNQALAALVFDDVTERLRSYLRIFFLENYERARQLSFGGVQPNLSLGVIRDMPVPLPPYDEQVEIARRVDQLHALAIGIELRINAAFSRTDRSSQAILAKAFRGELIVRPKEDA